MSGDALDDKLDSILTDGMKQAWDERQSRQGADYDGILGELPSWIPENFHYEFHRVREKLLATYAHDDLKRYLTRFNAEQQGMLERALQGITVDYNAQIPFSIWREISILSHFKDAVELESEKGMALLTDPEHSKRVTMGEDYSRQQSDKASKPRGKVSDDGETIGQIIGKMALSGDQEESASDLWPSFYSKLEELGLSPHESNHLTDPKKCAYEYGTPNGERRSITFGQFANVASEYRTGKKSG